MDRSHGGEGFKGISRKDKWYDLRYGRIGVCNN